MELDLGNNESLKRGVFLQQDGRWLAMTFSRSQSFKTEAGAKRWYLRNGGETEN